MQYAIHRILTNKEPFLFYSARQSSVGQIKLKECWSGHKAAGLSGRGSAVSVMCLPGGL